MSPPRKRASVSRAELVRAPNLAWNAFVDLLTATSYEDHSAEQRIAHLAFSYDREIHNGGHASYFGRRGVARLNETVEALRQLGGQTQAEVLLEAAELWNAHAADSIEGAGEGIGDALERQLDRRDRAFHACEPDVPALLHEHLQEHLKEFIEVVDP